MLFCSVLRLLRQSINSCLYIFTDPVLQAQGTAGLGAGRARGRRTHSTSPNTCPPVLIAHQSSTGERQYLDHKGGAQTINASRAGPSLNHNTGSLVLCGWKVVDLISHPNSPPGWPWRATILWASVSSSGTFKDHGDTCTVFSTPCGLFTKLRCKSDLFTSTSCGCTGHTRARWHRNRKEDKPLR